MKAMLLDGNSLAYRAFYALPSDMASSSGQVTNAVVGFTTMLAGLLREHRPDRIAVAFDRPEPTFRHEAAPEYKAQREAQPEVLYQQLGLIRELLVACGIVVVDAAGFEGDDVIATLAAGAERDGVDEILVVTGDRDSFQLVRDPVIRVVYNKRGVSDYALYDEAGIVERTGVTPSQYVDYAALRGDPSDNLDGVPGVGEKTAARLLVDYGSLDAVLEAASEQKPKLAAALAEHGPRVRRNAGLMVLRDDVPVDTALVRCEPRPDLVALRRLLDFLEIRGPATKLLAELARFSTDEPEASGPAGVASPSPVFVPAETIAGRETWVVAPCFSGSTLDGVAVVADASNGSVVWLDAAALADAVPARVVGHDVKPLLRWWLDAGRDAPAIESDTAIASFLLDPSSHGGTVADALLRHTGSELVLPNGAADGELDFSGDAGRYRAAAEALAIHALRPEVERAIGELGIGELYRDVELPLVGVLARMEHVGIRVDVERLRGIEAHLGEEATRLAATLTALAGRSFNLNSPAQLREILYVERGLAPGRKTKTGFSTDAATLEKLRDQWPEFIDALMGYREVEKLRSTFGVGLLEAVAADGRIHATFNQTVARTGRLSSDRPNLHNIPVRTEEGRTFREAFVPRDGWSFLVADYNQIELRCIAHLARDEGLIEAFGAGRDVHTAVAARVFGVAESDVTPDMRSRAKMVSYGLAYGMESYGLAQRLGIEVGEAQSILDAYFGAYPRVRRYMDEVVAEARDRGYTTTLFGRRRPIPELHSANFRVRQAGERQAMNAAIQGLAADVFKIALVRIDAALAEAGHRATLVLQVHDEVVLEAPTEERDAIEALVLGIMRGAAELDVPLVVEAAWGPTWGSAKH